MTTYRFIWKIRGGDMYEQDYRGYEHEVDAADDWIDNHGIIMEEVESLDIKEIDE